MAADDSEQNKSEQPTGYKLDRARKKGVVARGLDLGFLTGLAAFLGYQWIFGSMFSRTIGAVSRAAFTGGPSLADGREAVLAASVWLLSRGLRPAVLTASCIFAAVLVSELVQTGFVFSAEPLKPDFSRLNPANGLKRVFSLRALIEVLKNLLKIAVYTTLAVLVVRSALESDVRTIADGSTLSSMLRRDGFRLLGMFLLAAAAFAVLDQLIVRNSFLKRMRMSRRELRRELRDREGEPRLKQKRKQLHREFTKASTSLKNIRQADVLVTNPEHIALGLKYEAKTMVAPTVVAIGVNHLAQRLKQLALLYNIPIVENRLLAQQLYRKCALDSAVPDAFYRPVADIYNAVRMRKHAEAGVLP